MEGCSLEDAFQQGPFGSANCADLRSSEISRRQEKKKARRCRGPALEHLQKGWNAVGAPDPDRPAAVRMEPVPTLNTSTGLTQHAPVTQQ